MNKMWTGRTDGVTEQIADDFDSSIRFDRRLYREDIAGSIAHAEMLKKQKIIPASAADHIREALEGIRHDLETGALEVDETCEDIHMFIEQVLTERIGEEGKMLHTARSRNDQVALDMRMYLRTKGEEIITLIRELIGVLNASAEQYIDVIMPGYTHMQRAQPIFLSQHLLAYEMMLLRDISRMRDALKRMDESPIGACALAGTTYDTDREYEARLLGFSGICANSMDAVSDRDFCLEFLSCLSILMMHLSRFSEELILWSGWEFRFIEFADSFTTGSSIMPQKKNADMAELVRGKTGRVYGDLIALLTVMKGLPLAYNKDMQEDKEAVFDAADTAVMCLRVFTPMIRSVKVNADNMADAARIGFLNATDLADYMVRKGLPFRDAYRIAGQITAQCIREGTVLESLPLAAYRQYWDGFDEDLYDALDLRNAADRRSVKGGTSRDSIREQIALVQNRLTD